MSEQLLRKIIQVEKMQYYKNRYLKFLVLNQF